jgi:hypothetical protein
MNQRPCSFTREEGGIAAFAQYFQTVSGIK